MRHDQYKELLHLSFYHELSDDEQSVLDRHMMSCPECREEVQELRKLDSVLGEGQRVVITDRLLDEARSELRVALRLEREKRSPWAEWADRLNVLRYPATRLALGGAATLVVGISIGYMVFTSADHRGDIGALPAVGRATSEQNETRVSNFRFISQSQEGGEVEFTFDLVTPVRMKGNINDNAVQRVMAQALLNEQNPGARLLTVSALASQVEATKTPDKEIKAALVQALKSDGNVGVRNEALKALEKFPIDNEIKDALLYVLKHEPNSGIRIEAINVLEKPVLAHQFADQDILNGLKESMQSDNNNYIRTLARNVYEEVKQQ